jgi:serine/threonine-protein kinase
MTATGPQLFTIGDLVAGVYEIRALLGAGANGEVYEAFDRRLLRRVALKASWRDALLRDLLTKEAQALAAIRHPSLLTVHALGTHDGVDFFVMELVNGVTLETHVERRKASGEPLSTDEALEILVAIAEGLAAVHRAGIAHRDVKPSNVMLAPGNRVLLTDFGLVVPEYRASNPDFSGTAEYMAPEAIRGQIAQGAGHLVDVYALGVLAFELLTGRLPYEGTFVQVLNAHVEAPIPDVPGVPPKLAALVREMLAKEPDARPQQLEAVAWRLRTLRAELGAASQPRPFSVIVVDDDKDIAKLLSMYVRAAVPSAKVDVATTPRAALELVRAGEPRLLILDLMMPEMNGIELYTYLRGERLAEHATIVAVSAGARPADVELLYELGVAYFVPKDAQLRARITEIAKQLHQMVG